jgi:hypothetical protein
MEVMYTFNNTENIDLGTTKFFKFDLILSFSTYYNVFFYCEIFK